jgi:hypothetical protein
LSLPLDPSRKTGYKLCSFTCNLYRCIEEFSAPKLNDDEWPFAYVLCRAMWALVAPAATVGAYHGAYTRPLTS